MASASKKRFVKEYPLVVKSRAGHGGQEVFLLHTEEECEKFFKAHAPDGYIVQQFCSEAGKDLRVYVLGGKILAGVLRSSDEDFRSNYSLGGRVESVPVPQEVQDMVKTLHDAYSFDFVGIDFIRHDGKWILNEVEDVVGSRMLYETTDLDAVKLYIEYVAGKLKANG